MDFEIGFRTIILVLSAYALLVCLLVKIANYIFGEDGNFWVMVTIGVPFTIVFVISTLIVNLIQEAVSWPWRYWNRRLISEVFLISLPIRDPEFCQKRIDEKLSELAYFMDLAFKQQEEARKTGDRGKIREATRLVRCRKKLFWQAHDVTSYWGFKTRPQYSDYLQK